MTAGDSGADPGHTVSLSPAVLGCGCANDSTPRPAPAAAVPPPPPPPPPPPVPPGTCHLVGAAASAAGIVTAAAAASPSTGPRHLTTCLHLLPTTSHSPASPCPAATHTSGTPPAPYGPVPEPLLLTAPAL